MRIYTVHERGGPEGEVAFVREGFSLWAFLFSFVWLWAQRAWLAGFLTLVALLLLAVARTAIGIAPPLALALQLAVAVGVGLFGHDLRRAALTRRGYVETGVVAAGGLDEAELRYFARRVGEASARHAAAPA
jgi:hypothetical protein